MRAYYARPMSMYGTPQEERDKIMLARVGVTEIIPFTKEMEARVPKEGMTPFLEAVATADVLYYRAFPCGRIGAGVGAELSKAVLLGIPVFEVPTLTPGRFMTPEQTREYLALHGQR